MRKLFIAALVTLACSLSASAQIATFTWGAGTISNSGYTYSAQFTTIDGYQANAAFGFSGYVQINFGNSLVALSVPEPGTCSIPRNPDGTCSGETFPNFPNNGRFGTCSNIVWGQNQWGARSDGSTMDGSKVGDQYTKLGTASCSEWNGSVNISLTELHEFDYQIPCTEGRGRAPEACDQDDLRDIIKSGSGTASCVPGSGSFGACGSS